MNNEMYAKIQYDFRQIFSLGSHRVDLTGTQLLVLTFTSGDCARSHLNWYIRADLTPILGGRVCTCSTTYLLANITTL